MVLRAGVRPWRFAPVSKTPTTRGLKSGAELALRGGRQQQRAGGRTHPRTDWQQPISRALVLEAIDAKQRFGVSYWDAAIVTAARQMGCQTVYSEDLNHGQIYDGVTVVNPFKGTTP